MFWLIFLDSQNGSLGGSVDCIIDVARSKQKMRLVRADQFCPDSSSNYIFASAARGSMILPPDGSVGRETTYRHR